MTAWPPVSQVRRRGAGCLPGGPGLAGGVCGAAGRVRASGGAATVLAATASRSAAGSGRRDRLPRQPVSPWAAPGPPRRPPARLPRGSSRMSVMRTMGRKETAPSTLRPPPCTMRSTGPAMNRQVTPPPRMAPRPGPPEVGTGAARLLGRRRSSTRVPPTRRRAPARHARGRAVSLRQHRRRRRVPLVLPASQTRTRSPRTRVRRWARETSGSVTTRPRPTAPERGTGRTRPASGPRRTARYHSLASAS